MQPACTARVHAHFLNIGEFKNHPNAWFTNIEAVLAVLFRERGKASGVERVAIVTGVERAAFRQGCALRAPRPQNWGVAVATGARPWEGSGMEGCVCILKIKQRGAASAPASGAPGKMGNAEYSRESEEAAGEHHRRRLTA